MNSILKIISRKLISRGAGFLANQKFPPFLLQSFIDLYRYIYKVDLKESKGKQDSFETFNEFFTRDVDFSKEK